MSRLYSSHYGENLTPPDQPSATIAQSSARSNTKLANQLRALIETTLCDFPWHIVFRDWTGLFYAVGANTPHWSGDSLEVSIKSPAAARCLLSYNAIGFLEKFLEGEVDLDGNLYLLPSIRAHARLDLKPLQAVRYLLAHNKRQNSARARASVRSHYDVPQAALDVYLDRTYKAYSCAMFDDPGKLDRHELVRIGSGQDDDFDSLERAQWRKFKDAIDYIAPSPSDTLLDVGCGYGGQLLVALQTHTLGKCVGWTHSRNQVSAGAAALADFDPDLWELNQGDYRSENRVFDHVTSTGMVSHVGPRGLVPYVRNIRRRIRSGGRYVHHALMKTSDPAPLNRQLGPVFNKRYVWPGFHWFTLGEHVRALEKNGFEIQALVNLSDHYAKTTAAWYERMILEREAMAKHLGEATFRAWRIYLAGSSGDFTNKGIHVYRIYCRAL